MRRMGLVRGFTFARSDGPGTGRRTIYDAAGVAVDLALIRKELSGGISLEEQARRRGWHNHGWDCEVPLRDIVAQLDPGGPDSEDVGKVVEAVWRVDPRGNWKIVPDRKGRAMVQFRVGSDQQLLSGRIPIIADVLRRKGFKTAVAVENCEYAAVQVMGEAIDSEDDRRLSRLISDLQSEAEELAR